MIKHSYLRLARRAVENAERDLVAIREDLGTYTEASGRRKEGPKDPALLEVLIGEVKISLGEIEEAMALYRHEEGGVPAEANLEALEGDGGGDGVRDGILFKHQRLASFGDQGIAGGPEDGY